MSSQHFRRALAATARVACLASVGACSANAGAKIPASPAAQATVEPAVPAAPEVVAEPASDNECATVFANLKSSDSGGKGSAAEQACCVQAMDKAGKDSFEEPPELAAIGVRACCSIIGDWGERYSACTPWGPPSPPEMMALS